MQHFTTIQQVFDHVVTHLLTQNARAINNESDCLYRTPNGTQCAIGCLIPDERYDPSLEHQNLDEIFPAIEDLLPADVKFLLEDLQTVHDNIPVANWTRHLTTIAVDHGLEYRPPETTA